VLRRLPLARSCTRSMAGTPPSSPGAVAMQGLLCILGALFPSGLISILQILVVNQTARIFGSRKTFHTNQKIAAAHFSQDRPVGHTANEVGFRKHMGSDSF